MNHPITYRGYQILPFWRNPRYANEENFDVVDLNGHSHRLQLGSLQSVTEWVDYQEEERLSTDAVQARIDSHTLTGAGPGCAYCGLTRSYWKRWTCPATDP